MKKSMYVIECVQLVNYFNQLSKDEMDALPLKVKWSVKRAMDKMVPDVKAFEEFRDAESAKIREKYFDDSHTKKVMLPKMDADGKPELDADGNEVLEEGLQIKDEYLEAHEAEIKDLNKKLEEILRERNTYEYNRIDIDDYIDSIDEKAVSFTTLSLIDEIFKEEV